MLGTSPHSSRNMGRRKRWRISDESSGLEDRNSEETLNRGSMEEGVSEHDQEAYQEKPVSVSESSSTCTHYSSPADTLEASSGESFSDPSTRAVILLRMQRILPVLLLSKVEFTGEVCPWAESDCLMVSVSLRKLPKYRGRLETTQVCSHGSEAPGYSGAHESFTDSGSEDDEQMSKASTHHLSGERLTPDSEDVELSQMVTINGDGAGGDLEENIVTTLSSLMHKDVCVQPMIVPECSYFGTEDLDQLQPIERVNAPVVHLTDLPPGDHSPHSADDSMSVKLPQSEHNSIGPKRRKRLKKVSTLDAAAESGVEGQSSKEQSPRLVFPQYVSESTQESCLDLPESAAMDTNPQLPQGSPCAAKHLRDGSLSPDPLQSTMEQQTTPSSTGCPSVEHAEIGPVEDGTSNGESSIQVKCEAFYANFKSTERYSFDVPFEYPDCARLVPIMYHLQRPSSYVQKMKDREEKRHLRKLSKQMSGAHVASLPATPDGVRQFKQEPLFADGCNSGEVAHPPDHMETSTPCATALEAMPPVTHSVLGCACLPLTPPEQSGERTLGTKDLSVKDLLSQFTEGNDEVTEEEREAGTDDEVMGASGPHTKDLKVCLRGGGDNSDVLTWLVSGESNDVSVGLEARSGGKTASLLGLDLLTPTTLESLPTGKGVDNEMTGVVGISSSFSPSPCQADQIVSESPLPSKEACEEMEDVCSPGEGSASGRDHNMEGDKNIQTSKHGKKMIVTESRGQEEGGRAPLHGKKRRVGRPRKTDKDRTALEPFHTVGRRMSARTAVANNSTSLPDQNASESPVSDQKTPKETEDAPQDEGCAAFAKVDDRESNVDDDRDILQPAGNKEVTAGDTINGSPAQLQQGMKRKVGRPRKSDKSPPPASVSMVNEQDGIGHSRKRTRSASELASPAKRSRKSSSPLPEREPATTNKDISPMRDEVQSPKPRQPRRHSARLLVAECVKDASSTPDQPTSNQDPPDEAANLTIPFNSAQPPDEKSVNAPVTTSDAPDTGKKRGRKIKLRSAKQMVQHETSQKLRKGNNVHSQTQEQANTGTIEQRNTQTPQPARVGKMEESPQVTTGTTDGPSAADVQWGCTPSADVPFTFNLEKNQERLLKLPARSGREPAANTQQPPNPTQLSFSFVVSESKAKSHDPNSESKAKVTLSTSRLDEAWASNSDSPPPPLPQTPSSSISPYQPSPANSIGDMEVFAEGGLTRKPEEGDLLEIHPLGDFDDVSLLGDGAQASAGELVGHQSKAVKCVLKSEQKWAFKPERKEEPVHLKAPQKKLNTNVGRVPPLFPPNASPMEKHQRVRDWVEDVSREPPLPPPQQLLKTTEGPLQPEEDEEFVSASIVNGPIVMATYSEPAFPPSNQHGPVVPEPRGWVSNNHDPPTTSFRRWRGFCRYHLLNVPCLHKPCFFHHCPRLELPSDVLHHLAMVERVGNITEKSMIHLTDDTVVMLDRMLQGLQHEDLMLVWRLKTELEEKRIYLTTQFHESFLKGVTTVMEIPDAMMHMAEQTFFHLRSIQWRKEAHRVMDYENIILCHLKRNEIQSVCDILFTMAEHNFVPSVETIELFIVAVGRAHSVDMEATEQLVKMALHLVVKYVNHMPNIMNQFFPILLKTPSVFVDEVKLLLQFVMQNNLYALELENIVPVINLCLCHSWAPELEHIISHCHFVNLLPADTVQAVLRAVSADRIPVSVGSHVVGKLSEAQRRHVDPQTWVGLLEHFCQYGKANLVTKVQQICKELELIVPDMVLWEVLNYFVRVHNMSAAAEVFFQLKELNPSFFNTRCVSAIFKTLKETKDYVSLYRTLKKLLEHRMTDHLQELIPVFQWLLDNNLVKEISCIVNLIHSCRDSLRLPPRPVLEQAERKLIEWGKGDEALEKVAEMLGRAHPNAAVVPQEEIPPPPNGPPPHHAKDLIARVSPSTPVGTTAGAPTHHKKERLDLIEGILMEGEWDVAALMISRMNPLPEQVGQIVFRALVQLAGYSDVLSSNLARFIKGFQLSQSTAAPAALEEAQKNLIARTGLSLILHCCATSQWLSGFATLQFLHSHGLHYVQCDPVMTATTKMFSSEGSRMMAAAKICMETCTGMAITVLRGCNWKSLEADDEEGIRLAKNVVPQLVHHHLDNGELPTAHELLGHMDQYLEGAAEELYFVLFDKFLSAQELEKACEVAILLLKQWKRVRKVKLVELLIRLRSANMLEKKGQVLRLALEAGVLQKIGNGQAQNDCRIAKDMSKEESALLLEQHLEELCLLYYRLKEVTLTFPDVESLHNSLDYLSNFPRPPLQGCKVNDAHLPPTITIPAYTIETWRKANVNKSLWGSKGCKQQRNFRSPPTPKKQWADGGKEKGRRLQQGPGRPNHWPHISPPSHLPQGVPYQSTLSQSPTEMPFVTQQVQGTPRRVAGQSPPSLTPSAHQLKGMTGRPPPEASPSANQLKVTGPSPTQPTPSMCPNDPAHQQSAHIPGKNVKPWKRQWRMAVSKEVHWIVYPYKSTKFTNKDDRQYFVQSTAMKFSKMVEHREPGPWHLTAARKQALQDYMTQILSQFTTYTTEVADHLNL